MAHQTRGRSQTARPTKTLELGLTREAVEEVSRRKDEPAWMRERRLAAWRAYEQLPMPTTQDEEWRRTDISGLDLDAVVPYADPDYRASDLAGLPSELRRALREADKRAGILAQHDSVVVYRHLADELARQGVLLLDLDTAVREQPKLVEEHFMTECVPATESKLAALHGALWSGGVLLYVPRGVSVDLPVHAGIYQSTPRLGMFSHTLIVADRDSSVTFVDQLLSPTQPEQALSSDLVEIWLKEGAQVRYVNIQEWGRHTWHLGIHRTLSFRDTVFNSLEVAFGGHLAKTNVEVVTRGPGSSAELLGLYFGDDDQFFDYHTLQDHRSPHTSSDLLYKGALTGRARSVFSGLIRIHPGAQRSDAYQRNSNLLLSSEARADSIPNLEIQANDVRCTHGATVAPIDEEQLFYLQSRGLRRRDAERMIVDGFFQAVLDRIPIEGVRDRLGEWINRKL